VGPRPLNKKEKDMATKTAVTARVLGRTLTGVGTHGHKRGRPMLYNYRVVKALVGEAGRRGLSLRALCAEKGLTYISLIVAKGRYTEFNRTVNV